MKVEQWTAVVHQLLETHFGIEGWPGFWKNAPNDDLTNCYS